MSEKRKKVDIINILFLILGLAFVFVLYITKVSEEKFEERLETYWTQLEEEIE